MDGTGPVSGGRILLAKPGMDAHWRGAAVVAHVLRDAGFEVIYVGHASSEEILSAAIQEDVDVIGLSTLSGNHLETVGALLELLRRPALAGPPVIVGGNIPPGDVTRLEALGVHAVVGPTETAGTIVATMRRAVAYRRERLGTC